MARYAVVGASRGVGLALTEQLSRDGDGVRAISRSPLPGSSHVEPFSADVTNSGSLATALDDDFDAVFFTVESSGGVNGRGLFAKKDAVRETTYMGCVNTVQTIAKLGRRPRFILLSAMGVDQPSILWTVSSLMKAGMRGNMIDRERAVEASGLPYVILRSPILTDSSGGIAAVSATRPVHGLSGSMKIGRGDVAAAMIKAARFGPSDTTWDIMPGRSEDAAPWWRSEPPFELVTAATA